MMSVGESLRRERLKRNLELEQISQELKISSKFLDAIEEERFETLPGGVFAKSFVRQYARFLGLDEDELAGEVQRVVGPALSVGQGVVHVTWQIEADNLMLRWEERKGPAIEKTPTSEGFGSILVRRSIVGQLGGELDYIWKPEGFSAFISIPIERLSS